MSLQTKVLIQTVHTFLLTFLGVIFESPHGAQNAKGSVAGRGQRVHAIRQLPPHGERAGEGRVNNTRRAQTYAGVSMIDYLCRCSRVHRRCFCVLAYIFGWAVFGICADHEENNSPQMTAEYFITVRLNCLTSVVENIVQPYSTAGWFSSHDSHIGFVTHDRDGQPTKRYESFLHILTSEIRTNVVHDVLVSVLTNTFTVAELEAMNTLSSRQWTTILQYSSKEYFCQKYEAKTGHARSVKMPSVEYTKEELDIVAALSPAASSALRKLTQYTDAFNRAIADELRRCLAIARTKSAEVDQGSKRETDSDR